MVYHIIRESDNHELGLVDNVVYIEFNKNGDFTISDEVNAIGVAYMGIAYNLSGHSEIEKAETVYIVKDEMSSVLTGMATYAELAAAIREGVDRV